MSEVATPTTPEKTVLTGRYQVWNLNGSTRKYADVHMPYRDAREFIQAVRYDALRGRGEQRQMADAHARKIKGEMWAGTYTPTQMAGNLRQNHRENLKLDEANRTFELTIFADNPLAQTDGSHRYGAIEKLLSELNERLAKLSGAEKVAVEKKIEEVLNLEIGIRIFFDGDAQKDFINLQASRPVDRSHLLSMRIQKGLAGDESMKVAFGIAKLITKNEASPFKGLVRFDSKANTKASMLKQMPISTILAKSASDLSTSLVGLAKLGLSYGKSVDFLAACVTDVYLAIKNKAEDLFAEGKVLTPIRNGGTKGSATMLIGVAICFAQHLILNGREEPTAADLDLLVETAKAVMDEPISGSFTTATKRSLMGDFAKALFELNDNLHCGIPIPLLKATSPSAYAVESFPKEQKSRKGEVVEETPAGEPVTEESLAAVAGVQEQTVDAEAAVIG